MVRLLFITIFLLGSSCGTFAQEWLHIHLSSGEVKRIPFSEKPVITFDKKDVMRVETKSSVVEYLFADFKTLGFSGEISGDANGDGVVDVADVVAVVNYILGKASGNFNEAAANINGDEEIDVADVVGIVNIILGRKVVKP